MQESEVKIAQRGQVHTLTWQGTRYGDNGVEDSIDGSRVQQQALVMEETIQRPPVGRAGQARAKGFRGISKI